MKKLSLMLLILSSIYANDTAHKFTPSKECQTCHTKIYDEFYSSMHANSTPQKDPIHNAVWSKSPQKNKNERYSCGKCHTPTADNLDSMKKKGSIAMPDINNATHQEGISCAYCHRIQSIEIGKMHNTNIISKEEKSYISASKGTIESPFHKITSKGNEHIKNGNICIGCHSHKMNKAGLNVCSTDIDNGMNKENCVSCHMPKVNGSISELSKTAKHSFHGFAGAHANYDLLEKYVYISIDKNKENFKVEVKNHASHALLLHPLRVAVLKVEVVRDSKTTKLKNEIFVRVIGHDGKPTLPWAATTTIKNTMIQANEKRDVEYDFKLQDGDKVNVVLGWYLVNPKAVKKLGLENDKVATKFHEFKKQSFSF